MSPGDLMRTDPVTRIALMWRTFNKAKRLLEGQVSGRYLPPDRVALIIALAPSRFDFQDRALVLIDGSIFWVLGKHLTPLKEDDQTW